MSVLLIFVPILFVIAVGWAIQSGVKNAYEPGVCPKCGADTEVYCDKLTDIYYVCTRCDYVVNWDEEDKKDEE